MKLKQQSQMQEITLTELTSHVENWRVTVRSDRTGIAYVFYRKGNAGNFEPVYTMSDMRKAYRKISEIAKRLKSYKRKADNAKPVDLPKVYESLSNEAMAWIAKEKAKQAKKSANAVYLDRIKKQAQAHKRHNQTDNGQSAKLNLADIWPTFVPAKKED